MKLICDGLAVIQRERPCSHSAQWHLVITYITILRLIAVSAGFPSWGVPPNYATFLPRHEYVGAISHSYLSDCRGDLCVIEARIGWLRPRMPDARSRDAPMWTLIFVNTLADDCQTVS